MTNDPTKYYSFSYFGTSRNKTLTAIIVSMYYETFQRTRKRHPIVIIGFSFVFSTILESIE